MVTRIQQHSFELSLLTQDSIVFDLGANRGSFAHDVLKHFGGHVVAVEANPAMSALIASHTRLTVVNAAVSRDDRPVTLHVDANPESSTIRDGDHSGRSPMVVGGTCLQSLFDRYAPTRPIDLVKMDIEGAEIDALFATPDDVLNRVCQFTIEFHELPGWTPVGSIRALRARMARLGFVSIRISYRHLSDVLFLNRQRIGPEMPRILCSAHVFRLRRWAADGCRLLRQRVIR